MNLSKCPIIAVVKSEGRCRSRMDLVARLFRNSGTSRRNLGTKDPWVVMRSTLALREEAEWNLKEGAFRRAFNSDKDQQAVIVARCAGTPFSPGSASGRAKRAPVQMLLPPVPRSTAES